MKNFFLGLLSGALALAIWVISRQKDPIVIENLNDIQNRINKLKTNDLSSVDLTNSIEDKKQVIKPKKRKFLGIFVKKNKV